MRLVNIIGAVNPLTPHHYVDFVWHFDLYKPQTSSLHALLFQLFSKTDSNKMLRIEKSSNIVGENLKSHHLWWKITRFFFITRNTCVRFIFFSFIHRFFLVALLSKLLNNFQYTFRERTFTSYARCRWTVLTCNLYMMAKKRKDRNAIKFSDILND